MNGKQADILRGVNVLTRAGFSGTFSGWMGNGIAVIPGCFENQT
jgi:hypothetical protein